jgi:hypothetical protein
VLSLLYLWPLRYIFCNFNILILIIVLVLHIPLYLNIPEDGDLIAETCRWVKACVRLAILLCEYAGM